MRNLFFNCFQTKVEKKEIVIGDTKAEDQKSADKKSEKADESSNKTVDKDDKKSDKKSKKLKKKKSKKEKKRKVKINSLFDLINFTLLGIYQITIFSEKRQKGFSKFE